MSAGGRTSIAIAVALMLTLGPAFAEGSTRVSLGGDIRSEYSNLMVSGDEGDNTVRVLRDRRGREDFVITDRDGVRAGSGCDAVRRSRARCPDVYVLLEVRLLAGDDDLSVAGGSYYQASVQAGTGNDRVAVKGRGTQPRVLGEVGNDFLLGGGGSSRLFGGAGNDRISGRAGNDKAFGSDGRDALRGGGGDDQLHTEDGSRDERIRCGAGDDFATIDSSDPRPHKSCEAYGVVDHPKPPGKD